MGHRLLGRTWATRSSIEPFLRNFGLKVAKGPNSREVSPSTTRVSRCGTDMGGAPTEACEYTFAWCLDTRAGFVVFSHCPPIGKTPYPLISGMPDFCSSLIAQPPAPTNTKRASVVPGV